MKVAKERETFLATVSMFNSFYRPRGRIVQSAQTVGLLDAIEGYHGPGGARDIYESDLVDEKDIFKPNPFK